MKVHRNLGHIKRQLSHAPKNWSYLENEFNKIMKEIEEVNTGIKSMAKMSVSTRNLMDLFRTHSEESNNIEAQNECFMCFELLNNKEKVIKFVCEQKQRLSDSHSIKAAIKHEV